MKVCFKCNLEKPLSDYYKHGRMADGHMGKCKECTKNDVKLHKKANIDYVMNYDRSRPNKDERNLKSCERNKEKYHSDSSFKKSILKSKEKWIKENPQKRNAQVAAGNALRDGKIARKTECEHCNSGVRLQKHHWSYEPEHWLDVIWLCTKCHAAEHKKLNEMGRDPDKGNK